MTRTVVAVAGLAWAALWSGPAVADLYRWVDPATGSVKFSSYPPPWFGDPAQARRAPKVEVIPGRRSAPSSEPRPGDEARREPKPADQPAALPATGPESAARDRDSRDER